MLADSGRHNLFAIAVIGLAFAPLRSTAGAIIYVDAGATGADTGANWTDAFSDLQDALVAATAGDELWVAAGVYTPSDTDATASFIMTSGVAVYGGFNGTEASRHQRDWFTNVTTLSGDIGGDDVVSPWPSGWNINTSNVGHVVVASGVDRSAILDGFTIANGHTGPVGTPAGHELMFGSGVYIVGGSPTIRHCKFLHNLAAFASGGGLYCSDGSPLIEHCRFEQNYAHAGGGGGMFVYGNSVPEIRQCEFIGNISVATSVSNVDGDAAGMGIYSTAWVTVSDCRFEGNVARPFFSVGDELGYGGGLWVWNGGVTVERCTFRNNTANYGGGMISWGPAIVVSSLFQNNRAIAHPNDPYPEQGGDGAAIVAWSAAPDVVDVVNCTLAYNQGKKYVGAVGFWNVELNLYNCIVRNNTGTNPETINTWKEQINGFANIKHSNVSHIFEPHGPGEDPLDPENLPGVIDADALFVSPSASGDLRLAAGSPSIDAGDNGLMLAGMLTDLDGNPRRFDDPATPDTGVGTPPIVDMGAYEYVPTGLPGDFDGDGDVDTTDFGVFALCFGGALNPPAASCPAGVDADLDGDGDVDVSDFALFAQFFTGSM